MNTLKKKQSKKQELPIPKYIQNKDMYAFKLFLGEEIEKEIVKYGLFPTVDRCKNLLKFYDTIGINPKDAQAYSSRGIAYYKKGDTTSAIKNFRNALDVDYNSRKKGLSFEGIW